MLAHSHWHTNVGKTRNGYDYATKLHNPHTIWAYKYYCPVKKQLNVSKR